MLINLVDATNDANHYTTVYVCAVKKKKTKNAISVIIIILFIALVC